MNEKDYMFIEQALFTQRVTIRRTKSGHLVFRKDGRTMGFVHADADVHELQTYLFRLAGRGHIRWPPW